MKKQLHDIFESDNIAHGTQEPNEDFDRKPFRIQSWFQEQMSGSFTKLIIKHQCVAYMPPLLGQKTTHFAAKLAHLRQSMHEDLYYRKQTNCK